MIDRDTIRDLITDIRCSDRWSQDMSESESYRTSQLNYARKYRARLAIWFKNRYSENVLDPYGYPKNDLT